MRKEKKPAKRYVDGYDDGNAAQSVTVATL